MDKQTKQKRQEIIKRIKVEDKPTSIITCLSWLVAMLVIFAVVGWTFGFYQYLQQDIKDAQAKQDYCKLAEYFCMKDDYIGECRYNIDECYWTK